MHTRKQIIENQKQFREEILSALKEEMKTLRKDLARLDTNDEFIAKERDKLLKVSKKVKGTKEFEKLFISHKNIYPKLYAWWDADLQEVNKYKYKD